MPSSSQEDPEGKKPESGQQPFTVNMQQVTGTHQSASQHSMLGSTSNIIALVLLIFFVIILLYFLLLTLGIFESIGKALSGLFK